MQSVMNREKQKDDAGELAQYGAFCTLTKHIFNVNRSFYGIPVIALISCPVV
jgi:hypothetical protein